MSKPVNIPAATGVLNRLASELVAGNGAYPPVTVYVVDQPSYNSRALSNGVVMVHVGLLRKAKSPEEVAFGLAHELSHLELQYHQRYIQTAVPAGMVGMAASYTMRQALLKLGRNYNNKAARLMVSLAAWLPPFQWVAKWNRQEEIQADLNAVRLLTKAGYDAPSGASALIARMVKAEENIPAVTHAYLSLLGDPHPPALIRKTAVEQQIQAESTEKVNAARSIMSLAEWQALKQAVESLDDD